LKNLFKVTAYGIGEARMIIEERAFTEIESKPLLDETVKIMDEMDHLLYEMQEIMALIKRILGEESKDQAHDFSTAKGIAFRPAGNIIHGS
jgi:hypothetical protein